MVVNFAVGSSLNESKLKHQKYISRKAILTVGIIFNLGLLGYYKYADFFIGNTNWLFSSNIPLLKLMLPLAISFFTFQQIAYLVDCYKEKTLEYDFLNYCLFVTFFPQLIAGPIVHHKDMMPQFVRPRNYLVNWKNLSLGLFLFSIGLFKKVYIADNFAEDANIGYGQAEALTFLDAWATSLSYTFQLYFDFSGYTDMALGAALMLNIKLPWNFNSPYKAVSIQDFWRRWHMTLSHWLRDYLYIPLGGNKKGETRTYINLFITFLLGGLWHGAGWPFVIWGALHGLATTVHKGWQTLGFKMPRLLAWFTTFLFVHCAWVFFRAESISQAWSILKGMVGANGISLGDTANIISQYAWSVPQELLVWDSGVLNRIVIFGLAAFLLPNSIQMMQGKGWLGFKSTPIKAIFLGGILGTALSIMLVSKGSEFLYFNF